MTSSLSDIHENVKLARENALLGSYETSEVYYQGALQQIQKYLLSLADLERKQKWQEVASIFLNCALSRYPYCKITSVYLAKYEHLLTTLYLVMPFCFSCCDAIKLYFRVTVYSRLMYLNLWRLSSYGLFTHSSRPVSLLLVCQYKISPFPELSQSVSPFLGVFCVLLVVCRQAINGPALTAACRHDGLPSNLTGG